MITTQQTAEQKDRLPMGWGRFGKAIDHLIEVSQPDEQLLAACVTLNPTFVHHSITLRGGLYELTKSTNVVLGATNERLIIVATGVGGGPASNESLPYEGMEIVARDKKEVTLRWPDGEARFHGAAKPMLAPLLTVLDERIRAAAVGADPAGAG
jgi:hypothetical protein